MHHTPLTLLFAGLFLLLLSASGCDRNSRPRSTPMSKEELIDANKKRANLESSLIDDYVEGMGWDMQSSRTGIRYEVYGSASAAAKSAADSARAGQAVGITYTAFLLDSTQVATTGGEVQYFRVGHDDVISGLHEAVTLLARGDSVRLIIPSFLAYGLTGKSPTIPPNAPLYYDLCLVDIR